MAFRKLLSERFWEKVDIRSGAQCWEWKGGKNPDGYGTIGEGGRNGRILSTHRVAWFLEHREWPEEHVLHRCDNPGCVRISHLFLGSHADNMRDRSEKGRASVFTGEENPAARLTEAHVLEIRRLHALGHSQAGLARRFGCGESTVGRIVHRKNWTHI